MPRSEPAEDGGAGGAQIPLLDPPPEFSLDPQQILIESSGDLEVFLDEVRGSFVGKVLRCALDTEADSLHCYREKLCLVQFCSGDHVALIDPLRVKDLSPLIVFLREAEVWMHGADFDMLMLQRTFGEVPEKILDTQTAARLLGYHRFGLAAMIEQVFGVVLSKSSQRADWGKRPLSDKMARYAVNDVWYLLQMADHLVERLDKLGRTEWFYESCVWARRNFLERPEKSNDDTWRISGWGKLQPRGLAYLRAIWQWRDKEASKLDRPAFKVLGNDILLNLALQLQAGKKAELKARIRPDSRKKLFESIDRATELPKSEWPVRRRPRGDELREENEEEFNRLRGHRDTVASGLDLEPTLIATRAVLERLSVKPEEASSLLMGWQQGVFFDGSSTTPTR